MTMSYRPLSLAVLLLTSILSTACLNRPEVRSEGSRELSAETQLGSVAVFPFNGHYGDMLASRISYELLQRGYGIIPQERVRAALAAEDLGTGELYAGDGHARIMEVAGKLGADTVIVGTVTARERADNQLTQVADQFRAAAPLKVKKARAEFLRVTDGTTLAAATFQGDREYGVFTPNYRDAARGLVEAVFGE